MITLEITAEDIQGGASKSSKYCPIALAGQRAFGVPLVTVGCTTIRVAGSREYYLLPFQAQCFVRRFDYDLPVEPFTFTLDGPAGCDLAGYQVD
jgi:hypothetical protein